MLNRTKTLFLAATLISTAFSIPAFANSQSSKVDLFLNSGHVQKIEKIDKAGRTSGATPQAAPPKFVEESTKTGTILLQLDEGEAMLKMVTCLQARLPGFPTSPLLDMAKQTALAAMRMKNGSAYFPQELLQLSCADSDFERYFDNQKIATTQGWQKLLKMYQDAPASAEVPGSKSPKVPKGKSPPKSPDITEENPKEGGSETSKEENTEIGHDQEQSATLNPNDYI